MQIKFGLFWAVLCVLLVFTRSSVVASRLLSNGTAMSMPKAYDTALLQTKSDHTFSDNSFRIRSQALSLDPKNRSALYQSFRWYRSQGNLSESSRLLPDAEIYNFTSRLPDYPLIKAEYSRQTNSWTQAVSYYQVALSSLGLPMTGFSFVDYYDSLGRSELISDTFDPNISHFRAGKYFYQAGDYKAAVDQAMWIQINASNRSDYLSWANYLLAVSERDKVNVEEIMSYLGQSLENAKNPQANVDLYHLARINENNHYKQLAIEHLSSLKPDWVIPGLISTCVDTWRLAGFDVDEEILSAGLEVILNLYWMPICGEEPELFGLVLAGPYWLQTGYTSINLFTDPDFEWTLPAGMTTYQGSSPECCGTASRSYLQSNSLRITSSLPNTRAAQPIVTRPVEGGASYLVAAMVQWENVNASGDVAAVIGGFWLDSNHTKLSGYDNTVDNLQEFVVEFAPKGNNYNSSQWSMGVSIVKSPMEAVRFWPWLGLTSKSDGFATVYLDSLMMIPISFPNQ